MKYKVVRGMEIGTIVVLALLFAYQVAQGTLFAHLELYGRVGWRLLGLHFIIAVAVSVIADRIADRFPRLDWSLFGRHGNNEGSLIANSAFWRRMFYGLALINLPFVVVVEEAIFRAPIASFWGAVMYSGLFGLSRALIGASAAEVIVAMLLGGWFSAAFAYGGIALSARFHLAYRIARFVITTVASRYSRGSL